MKRMVATDIKHLSSTTNVTVQDTLQDFKDEGVNPGSCEFTLEKSFAKHHKFGGSSIVFF